MATMTQIESFHQFAVERIRRDGTDLSMDDLYELWRLENLSTDELSESAAAVRSALSEMRDEDAWIDADDHLDQLRAKYNFSERP